jgi:Protein of unknown function (DUF732)
VAQRAVSTTKTQYAETEPPGGCATDPVKPKNRLPAPGSTIALGLPVLQELAYSQDDDIVDYPLTGQSAALSQDEMSASTAWESWNEPAPQRSWRYTLTVASGLLAVGALVALVFLTVVANVRSQPAPAARPTTSAPPDYQVGPIFTPTPSTVTVQPPVTVTAAPAPSTTVTAPPQAAVPTAPPNTLTWLPPQAAPTALPPNYSDGDGEMPTHATPQDLQFLQYLNADAGPHPEPDGVALSYAEQICRLFGQGWTGQQVRAQLMADGVTATHVTQLLVAAALSYPHCNGPGS